MGIKNTRSNLVRYRAVCLVQSINLPIYWRLRNLSCLPSLPFMIEVITKGEINNELLLSSRFTRSVHSAARKKSSRYFVHYIVGIWIFTGMNIPAWSKNILPCWCFLQAPLSLLDWMRPECICSYPRLAFEQGTETPAGPAELRVWMFLPEAEKKEPKHAQPVFPD